MFDAPGYFQLGQWTFGDLRAWGRIDFLTGFANSVNVVFYTLGYRLGGEELAKYAFLMGLGELTGVDLPGEINGTIPSPSTKEQLVGEPWFPGDSVNMSIGQGAVTVTPIQVARMLGGIATGGPLLQPRVVLMTYDRTRSAHPSEPYVQRSVPYQDSTLALLREGMRAVVERGSGYGARVEGLPMAGKTGGAGAVVRAPVLHAIFGLVVLALAAFIDYQTIARAWRPILGTPLFLLLAVLIVGRSSMGAQRWIPLGPLRGFQPSELAKLALIITLAKHMDGHKELTS